MNIITHVKTILDELAVAYEEKEGVGKAERIELILTTTKGPYRLHCDKTFVIESESLYDKAKSLVVSGEMACLYLPNYVEMHLMDVGMKSIDDDIEILDCPNDTSISIGEMSSLYKIWLISQGIYVDGFKKKIQRLVERANTEGVRILRSSSIIGQLPISPSIKFKGEFCQDPRDNYKHCIEIVDTILCQVSMQTGLAFEVRPSYEKRPKLIGLTYSNSGGEVRYPKAQYNTVLSRYYKMGYSAQWPAHQFLGFYQVLERRFTVMASQQLLTKVKKVIASPKFVSDENTIADLVMTIRGTKLDSDESAMLSTVINSCVSQDELLRFIDGVEMGKVIYVKHDIFGEQISLNPKDQSLLPQVIRCVKLIRNAIVHSSDKYEGSARYIPFSQESDELIMKFIPIVQYFAEMVIIGCAK